MSTTGRLQVGDRSMTTGRVLIVGVYLLNKDNAVRHLTEEFARQCDWDVQQAWIALGTGDIAPGLQRFTSGRQMTRSPKFTLVNRLLTSVNLGEWDFVIVCDDDIHVPEQFLDDYLAQVVAHDFALAQPARTVDSYIDHMFVRQLGGIAARETRFVEIGPLFSMRRDALRWLTPFSEESPMGWGYDFVWPCLLEERGLKLGVVDRTPVTHNLRKPVSHYHHADADRQRQSFLTRRPHLSQTQAFTIVESFAE